MSGSFQKIFSFQKIVTEVTGDHFDTNFSSSMTSMSYLRKFCDARSHGEWKQSLKKFSQNILSMMELAPKNFGEQKVFSYLLSGFRLNVRSVVILRYKSWHLKYYDYYKGELLEI